MKKTTLFLLTALFLLGCSKGARYERTLCLAMETSPNKLDPAFVVDVGEGALCAMIFQGLVGFSPSGEVVPSAAATWEILEGGKKYVFHLDRRMRFSNGRPVLASDVAFSFHRVLSPATASPRRWVLERVEGAGEYARGEAARIEGLGIPDDSTVVVELERPFRPFLMLLAMPAAMIVPAEAAGVLGERFASRPVGSGRWKLEEWQRGDEIILAPNEFHPGRSRSLRRIRIRIIPESFTQIAEFEAGALDILRVPMAEIDRFLASPAQSVKLQQRTELRVTYVGLNCSRGPFRDARVRRAFNLAIDVERMIEVLMRGQAVRATGAIPPGLGGYRQRRPYPHDPDGAERLLREAGITSGLSIEIWLRESPEGSRICEAIQGYLGEVGIRAKLVKREWSAFKEAVSQGRVDAFFLDWYGDYPDAENFLFPLFHSQNLGGGGNRAFFQNHTVDSLIELAQLTMDEESSHALYAAIDSLVYREAPWIYLYFPKSLYAISPKVIGYEAPIIYLGEDYTRVQKQDGAG